MCYMALGKARSFRLTPENEARLAQLCDLLQLDNPNMTLNQVISDYSAYHRYKPLIQALEQLFATRKE